MQMQADQDISRIGVVPRACKKKVEALSFSSPRAKQKPRERACSRSFSGKPGSRHTAKAKGHRAEIVIVDDSTEESDDDQLFSQPQQEARKGCAELAVSKVEEAPSVQLPLAVSLPCETDARCPQLPFQECCESVNKFGELDGPKVEGAPLSHASAAKNPEASKGCKAVKVGELDGTKVKASLVLRSLHASPANGPDKKQEASPATAAEAIKGYEAANKVAELDGPNVEASLVQQSLHASPADEVDRIVSSRKRANGSDKEQEEVCDQPARNGDDKQENDSGESERELKDSIVELMGAGPLKSLLESGNRGMLWSKSKKDKWETYLVPADANVKAARLTGAAVALTQKSVLPVCDLQPAMHKTMEGSLPVFPGFTIKSKVEAGGYSTVYRVMREGKNYALKCLKENSKSSQVSAEREMLRRFGGKDCIIKCLDFVCNKKGEQAFLFDYVEHDKTEVLKRSASVKDIQCYMRDLFTALAAMHKQGVAHRDVKPANFLYCRRLKRGLLVDLGLAQVQAHNAAMQGTTHSSAKLAPPAPPAPAAPETQSCLSELTRTSRCGSQSVGRDGAPVAVVSKKRPHSQGVTDEALTAISKKRRVVTFSASAHTVAGGHGPATLRKGEGETRAAQQSGPCTINKSSLKNVNMQWPIGVLDPGAGGPCISEGHQGGENSLADEAHKASGMAAPGGPSQGSVKKGGIAVGYLSGAGTIGQSTKHRHLESGFSAEAGLVQGAHTAESASAAGGERAKESRHILATSSWSRRVGEQVNPDKRTNVSAAQLGTNCKQPGKTTGKKEEKLPIPVTSNALATGPLRGSRGVMMMMAAQLSLAEGGHSALKSFQRKSPTESRNERGYLIEGKQKMEIMKPSQGKMQPMPVGQMQKGSRRPGSMHKMPEDISNVKNVGPKAARVGGSIPPKRESRKLVPEDLKKGHLHILKFHSSEKQRTMGTTSRLPLREVPRQKSLQHPKDGRQGGNCGTYTVNGLGSDGVGALKKKGACAVKALKQKFLVRKFREILKPKEGPCAGTKGYRAPEVLLRSFYQSVQVDIWSAGVTMANLMFGRSPFSHHCNHQESLLEIGRLCGWHSLERLAKLHGRLVSLPDADKAQFPGQALDEWCKVCQRRENISFPSEAYDLLQKCLEVFPEKRIMAEEALQHPFFLLDLWQSGKGEEPRSIQAQKQIDGSIARGGEKLCVPGEAGKIDRLGSSITSAGGGKVDSKSSEEPEESVSCDTTGKDAVEENGKSGATFNSPEYTEICDDKRQVLGERYSLHVSQEGLESPTGGVAEVTQNSQEKLQTEAGVDVVGLGKLQGIELFLDGSSGFVGTLGKEGQVEGELYMPQSTSKDCKHVVLGAKGLPQMDTNLRSVDHDSGVACMGSLESKIKRGGDGNNVAAEVHKKEFEHSGGEAVVNEDNSNVKYSTKDEILLSLVELEQEEDHTNHRDVQQQADSSGKEVRVSAIGAAPGSTIYEQNDKCVLEFEDNNKQPHLYVVAFVEEHPNVPSSLGIREKSIDMAVMRIDNQSESVPLIAMPKEDIGSAAEGKWLDEERATEVCRDAMNGDDQDAGDLQELRERNDAGSFTEEGGHRMEGTHDPVREGEAARIEEHASPLLVEMQGCEDVHKQHGVENDSKASSEVGITECPVMVSSAVTKTAREYTEAEGNHGHDERSKRMEEVTIQERKIGMHNDHKLTSSDEFHRSRDIGQLNCVNGGMEEVAEVVISENNCKVAPCGEKTNHDCLHGREAHANFLDAADAVQCPKNSLMVSSSQEEKSHGQGLVNGHVCESVKEENNDEDLIPRNVEPEGKDGHSLAGGEDVKECLEESHGSLQEEKIMPKDLGAMPAIFISESRAKYETRDIASREVRGCGVLVLSDQWGHGGGEEGVEEKVKKEELAIAERIEEVEDGVHVCESTLCAMVTNMSNADVTIEEAKGSSVHGVIVGQGKDESASIVRQNAISERGETVQDMLCEPPARDWDMAGGFSCDLVGPAARVEIHGTCGNRGRDDITEKGSHHEDHLRELAKNDTRNCTTSENEATEEREQSPQREAGLEHAEEVKLTAGTATQVVDSVRDLQDVKCESCVQNEWEAETGVLSTSIGVAVAIASKPESENGRERKDGIPLVSSIGTLAKILDTGVMAEGPQVDCLSSAGMHLFEHDQVGVQTAHALNECLAFSVGVYLGPGNERSGNGVITLSGGGKGDIKDQECRGINKHTESNQIGEGSRVDAVHAQEVGQTTMPMQVESGPEDDDGRNHNDCKLQDFDDRAEEDLDAVEGLSSGSVNRGKHVSRHIKGKMGCLDEPTRSMDCSLEGSTGFMSVSSTENECVTNMDSHSQWRVMDVSTSDLNRTHSDDKDINLKSALDKFSANYKKSWNCDLGAKADVNSSNLQEMHPGLSIQAVDNSSQGKNTLKGGDYESRYFADEKGMIFSSKGMETGCEQILDKNKESQPTGYQQESDLRMMEGDARGARNADANAMLDDCLDALNHHIYEGCATETVDIEVGKDSKLPVLSFEAGDVRGGIAGWSNEHDHRCLGVEKGPLHKDPEQNNVQGVEMEAEENEHVNDVERLHDVQHYVVGHHAVEVVDCEAGKDSQVGGSPFDAEDDCRGVPAASRGEFEGLNNEDDHVRVGVGRGLLHNVSGNNGLQNGVEEDKTEEDGHMNEVDNVHNLQHCTLQPHAVEASEKETGKSSNVHGLSFVRKDYSGGGAGFNDGRGVITPLSNKQDHVCSGVAGDSLLNIPRTKEDPQQEEDAGGHMNDIGCSHDMRQMVAMDHCKVKRKPAVDFQQDQHQCDRGKVNETDRKEGGSDDETSDSGGSAPILCEPVFSKAGNECSHSNYVACVQCEEADDVCGRNQNFLPEINNCDDEECLKCLERIQDGVYDPNQESVLGLNEEESTSSHERVPDSSLHDAASEHIKLGTEGHKGQEGDQWLQDSIRGSVYNLNQRPVVGSNVKEGQCDFDLQRAYEVTHHVLESALKCFEGQCENNHKATGEGDGTREEMWYVEERASGDSRQERWNANEQQVPKTCACSGFVAEDKRNANDSREGIAQDKLAVDEGYNGNLGRSERTSLQMQDLEVQISEARQEELLGEGAGKDLQRLAARVAGTDERWCRRGESIGPDGKELQMKEIPGSNISSGGEEEKKVDEDRAESASGEGGVEDVHEKHVMGAEEDSAATEEWSSDGNHSAWSIATEEWRGNGSNTGSFVEEGEEVEVDDMVVGKDFEAAGAKRTEDEAKGRICIAEEWVHGVGRVNGTEGTTVCEENSIETEEWLQCEDCDLISEELCQQISCDDSGRGQQVNADAARVRNVKTSEMEDHGGEPSDNLGKVCEGEVWNGMVCKGVKNAGHVEAYDSSLDEAEQLSSQSAEDHLGLHEVVVYAKHGPKRVRGLREGLDLKHMQESRGENSKVDPTEDSSERMDRGVDHEQLLSTSKGPMKRKHASGGATLGMESVALNPPSSKRCQKDRITLSRPPKKRRLGPEFDMVWEIRRDSNDEQMDKLTLGQTTSQIPMMQSKECIRPDMRELQVADDTQEPSHLKQCGDGSDGCVASLAICGIEQTVLGRERAYGLLEARLDKQLHSQGDSMNPRGCSCLDGADGGKKYQRSNQNKSVDCSSFLDGRCMVDAEGKQKGSCQCAGDYNPNLSQHVTNISLFPTLQYVEREPPGCSFCPQVAVIDAAIGPIINMSGILTQSDIKGVPETSKYMSERCDKVQRLKDHMRTLNAQNSSVASDGLTADDQGAGVLDASATARRRECTTLESSKGDNGPGHAAEISRTVSVSAGREETDLGWPMERLAHSKGACASVTDFAMSPRFRYKKERKQEWLDAQVSYAPPDADNGSRPQASHIPQGTEDFGRPEVEESSMEGWGRWGTLLQMTEEEFFKAGSDDDQQNAMKTGNGGGNAHQDTEHQKEEVHLSDFCMSSEWSASLFCDTGVENAVTSGVTSAAKDVTMEVSSREAALIACSEEAITTPPFRHGGETTLPCGRSEEAIATPPHAGKTTPPCVYEECVPNPPCERSGECVSVPPHRWASHLQSEVLPPLETVAGHECGTSFDPDPGNFPCQEASGGVFGRETMDAAGTSSEGDKVLLQQPPWKQGGIVSSGVVAKKGADKGSEGAVDDSQLSRHEISPSELVNSVVEGEGSVIQRGTSTQHQGCTLEGEQDGITNSGSSCIENGIHIAQATIVIMPQNQSSEQSLLGDLNIIAKPDFDLNVATSLEMDLNLVSGEAAELAERAGKDTEMQVSECQPKSVGVQGEAVRKVTSPRPLVVRLGKDKPVKVKAEQTSVGDKSLGQARQCGKSATLLEREKKVAHQSSGVRAPCHAPRSRKTLATGEGGGAGERCINSWVGGAEYEQLKSSLRVAMGMDPYHVMSVHGHNEWQNNWMAHRGQSHVPAGSNYEKTVLAQTDGRRKRVEREKSPFPPNLALLPAQAAASSHHATDVVRQPFSSLGRPVYWMNGHQAAQACMPKKEAMQQLLTQPDMGKSRVYSQGMPPPSGHAQVMSSSCGEAAAMVFQDPSVTQGRAFKGHDRVGRKGSVRSRRQVKDNLSGSGWCFMGQMGFDARRANWMRVNHEERAGLQQRHTGAWPHRKAW